MPAPGHRRPAGVFRNCPKFADPGFHLPRPSHPPARHLADPRNAQATAEGPARAPRTRGRRGKAAAPTGWPTPMRAPRSSALRLPGKEPASPRFCPPLRRHIASRSRDRTQTDRRPCNTAPISEPRCPLRRSPVPPRCYIAPEFQHTAFVEPHALAIFGQAGRPPQGRARAEHRRFAGNLVPPDGLEPPTL